MILFGHKDDLVFTCCVKQYNMGNSERVEFSSIEIIAYLFKQMQLQSKQTTDMISSLFMVTDSFLSLPYFLQVNILVSKVLKRGINVH